MKLHLTGNKKEVFTIDLIFITPLAPPHPPKNEFAVATTILNKYAFMNTYFQIHVALTYLPSSRHIT
jgi:hypothetical protein